MFLDYNNMLRNLREQLRGDQGEDDKIKEKEKEKPVLKAKEWCNGLKE